MSQNTIPTFLKGLGYKPTNNVYHVDLRDKWQMLYVGSHITLKNVSDKICRFFIKFLWLSADRGSALERWAEKKLIFLGQSEICHVFGPPIKNLELVSIPYNDGLRFHVIGFKYTDPSQT